MRVHACLFVSSASLGRKRASSSASQRLGLIRVLMTVSAVIVASGVLSASALADPGASSSAFVNQDTSASVNGTPNGVWPTPSLAAAHGSAVVAAGDNLGCPSAWACFWINSGYQPIDKMGKLQGNNGNFGAFTQPYCPNGSYHASYTWNDCISSIDDNKACNFNYFWDAGQRGQEWSERPGSAGQHGSIGSSNDQFSSDNTPC